MSIGETLLPITDKKSCDLYYANKKAGVCSMQGWRPTMEDAHLAKFNFYDGMEEMHMFGVFDGHGGAHISRFCQRHFLEVFKSNDHFSKGDFKRAFQESYLDIDRILQTPKAQKELRKLMNSTDDKNDFLHGGCTACVALIVGDTLYVANAGDSRCVISRDRKAVACTVDHTPELESEQERIEVAGGEITENGRIPGPVSSLNLSRAIGDLDFKQDPDLPAEEQIITALPDVFEIKLDKHDEFLILGCDGIWDYFTNQEIVEFVGYRLELGIPVSKICGELLDKLIAPNERDDVGSTDNMSCIIVTLKPGLTQSAKEKSPKVNHTKH